MQTVENIAESIVLEFEPASDAQIYFLNSTKRNILFNSGFGGGKTYIACVKLLLLLLRFNKSRAVIGRQKFTDLAKTTRETFFQVCPPELYEESEGGARADGRGYLRLINGSEVFFMHFDNVDMRSLKSLEINFLLLDQAEEIAESIYLGLDSRLGRKSDAEVPASLIKEYEANGINKWARNELTGKPLVPVYSFILINPPDEGELHYLIQRFHPKSEEWQKKWQHVNDYVWSSSRDNKALPRENLENMLSRDPEWVARYVDAEIGQGAGAIHAIHSDSIIEVDHEFVENLKKRASLARVLDHGSTSPTCCLWFAALKGFHYCYQEYYQGNTIISIHRRNINDLSGNDTYMFNLADPAIFKKSSEKFGGFWTVADEYIDASLDSPSIVWLPADNNEFATRNRINELLRFDPSLINPITGRLGSPRLFFVKRDSQNPQGCYHAIRELKGQKKLLLDTINGKSIYSDDRDPKVIDHSYDCIRYYCASHLTGKPDPIKKPSERSFLGIVNRLKALKKANYYQEYGMMKLIPLAMCSLINLI
jgi:hypothetical protein